MKLYYGKIDKIGDSGKDEEKSRYQVRLDAQNIVTGWIFLSKPFVKDNVADFTVDIGTPVWCILNEDFRTGIIGGAIVTKDVPQKEDNPEITQVFFKDESFIKYDRENHLFEIYVKGDSNKVNITADGGEVNIVCKNATITVDELCKIDGRVEVTGDAKFGAKMEVTGEVKMSDKLTVTGDIKTDADVAAGALGVKLTTHKHPYTDTPAGPATTQAPIP